MALIVAEERDGQLVEAALTYRAFDQRVRALAALLQRRFDQGDRVLILPDNDGDYAASMFACFFVAIAVPAFPLRVDSPSGIWRA